MSYRWKTIIGTWIFSLPIYILVMIMSTLVIHAVKQWNFFAKAGYCIIGGAFLCFVVSVVTIYLNRKVTVQNRIYGELLKSGHSVQYLELLETEAELVQNNGNGLYYYVIIQLANEYVFRHRAMEAIECLNRIKPGEIKTIAGSRNLNLYLCQYYDVQMAICDELNDPVRAENVMRDAGPYIQAIYGKNPLKNATIDEAYILYNCLQGKYDDALVHAEQITAYSNSETFRYVQNFEKTIIYGYMGDFDKLTRYADMAGACAHYKHEFESLDRILGRYGVHRSWQS